MTNDAFKLPVFETVSTAWAQVKGIKATFWAVLILAILLEFVGGLFKGFLHAHALWLPSVLLSIIFFFIQMLFIWGLCYIGIRRAAGLPIAFRMIKRVFSFGLLLRMLGLILISGLIFIVPGFLIGFASGLLHASDSPPTIVIIVSIVSSLVGIILVFVASFYILRLYIAKAFIIAKGMGPIEAIKSSYALTKGNVWRIVGLTLLNTIILLISVIPLGIGLIWSLPYLYINFGVMYRKFCERQGIAPV